jgi:hypothetical protein
MKFPALLSTASVGLLMACLVPACGADEPPPLEEGFVSLFDGHTLTGWDGNPKLWTVQEGAITGTSSDETPIQHNEFLIWKGEVADFVLRLQYRIADRGQANSGVQYRSKRFPEVGKWVVGGYQADIDASNRYVGILYEERGRGILALRGEKVILRADLEKGHRKQVAGSVGDPDEIVKGVVAGEWHDYEITARSNRLIHKLNGRVTVDVTDQDEQRAARRGILALQLHAGPAMQVQFRHLRIQPLE